MKVKKTKHGYSFKAENKGDCEDLRVLLSELSKSKRKAEQPDKVETEE